LLPKRVEEALAGTDAGKMALLEIRGLQERLSFAEEKLARTVAETEKVRVKNKEMGKKLGAVTSAGLAFFSQKRGLGAVMDAISDILRLQEGPNGPFRQTKVMPASCPGRTLIELLPSEGKAVWLSSILKVDETHAEAILDGTADITDAMAEKLAEKYPLPAEFWRRRQYNYLVARAVKGD
jgi:plasmid maintenance system antidote protein VapI